MQSKTDPVIEKKFNELLDILDDLDDEDRDDVVRYARFLLSDYGDKFIGRLIVAYDKNEDWIWDIASLVTFGLLFVSNLQLYTQAVMIVGMFILLQIVFLCLKAISGKLVVIIQKRLTQNSENKQARDTP